jgi:hypothetical protein
MKKQTAKILDEVEIPDRFADAEKAFEKADKKLPTITPAAERDPSRERKGGTVNLPVYVWDLIRDEAYRSRDPQNVVVLRALKALGLQIHEEDIQDLRKAK